MPIKKIVSTGECKVLATIWTDDIEDAALEQVRNLTTLPFIHDHIAIMPDVHWGMGSTIGAVIPTIKAIIPAAVGVDIGCGMIATRLNMIAKDLPDNLHAARSAIEAAIPHGRTDNGGPNDKGRHRDISQFAASEWGSLVDSRYERISGRHPSITGKNINSVAHLGTLGTGNHFIEVCLDKEDRVWVMLHSGSRGIGNKIGSYFIDKAKEAMERWHITLPDPNLAYLPEGSEFFEDYWQAVSWAQDFASMNRKIMMARTIDALEKVFGRKIEMDDYAVNCHHNYVAIENHYGKNVYVTRKGAVRAREGDFGIIPGSMGARSFIVRGKGNPESFCSCSHGAGRRMSRGEAKRTFSIEDLAVQTAGVECRKDSEVIDEIPMAYKDIDTVMANQSDLVEIVAELKQVLCVKG